MVNLRKIEDFNFNWVTFSHYEHPYNEIAWLLFWGIVIGGSIVYAILAKDFLFLIISFIGLFFFFHPIFYEPIELDIKINKEGVFINDRFYSWDDFIGFEIFEEKGRTFIYFVPKNILIFSPALPLEYYIEEEELRATLRKFLDEYKDAVPLWKRLFRKFYI